MTNRVFSINKSSSDLIKFLSSLMVAGHHYSQYVISHGLSDSIIYQLLSTQGGYLGVAIFFFLSGYGLMESEARHHLSVGAFLRKRLAKIYFPVLLLNCLWIPLYPLITKNHSFYSNWGGLVYDIFIGFNDSVLWFVKALIFLYLAFSLFAYIRCKFNEKAAVATLVLGTILVIIGMKIIWGGDYLLISIPMFLCGVLSSLCKNKGRNVFLPILSVVLSCIAMSVYLLVRKDFPLMAHSVFNYGFITVMLLFFAFVKVDFRSPKFLGDISYDIYLVHNKVLMSLIALGCVNLLWFIVMTAVISLLYFFCRKKIGI